MDTGMPLFFLEIQYLLLETIPLETIMRVVVFTGFEDTTTLEDKKGADRFFR